MKLLFIGGTGLISGACAAMALERGHELTIVRRGSRRASPDPVGARVISVDAREDPGALDEALGTSRYDAVVDWVAFKVGDVESDLRLFRGRTDQLVVISSATVYQRPPAHYRVDEDAPLGNPFWQYARDKIACEERLWHEHRLTGFPVTVVRPSLTYGPPQIPLCVGSWEHPWTVIQRMRDGRKVIVPGDGTSLWTLTWNEDFAAGLLGLLGRHEATGRAFHVTSDEVLTWEEIYRVAAEEAGARPHLVHLPSDLIASLDPSMRESLHGDKMHSIVFDTSRLRALVPDFRPQVRWREGVRRCLRWFEADSARQTVDAAADERWDRMIAAYERAFP